MLSVALKMLAGDRAKYAGLLFGVTFTAFLITFAASFFCGFMTRGFSLISENPAADVWVMDPATESVEKFINLPDSELNRVRGVEGVRYAAPLLLGAAEARFPGGQFQQFQVIGVDDATLSGLPEARGGAAPDALRAADCVVVDAGGTSGKMETPKLPEDRWPADGPHLGAPTRPLAAGDDLLVNDHAVRVVGVTQTLPRFPPRPLMYMTMANALRILPPERRRLTFVLATAAPGVNTKELAARIQAATGLRARPRDDFKSDTVHWYLTNSEDVGDVGTMLSLAMTIGFGVTGVMFFMFTQENLRQYAVLNAMGATPRRLLAMIFVQSGSCGLIGTGLGLGLCAIAGRFAAATWGFPFRMMWFTPLAGGLMVVVVCVVSALLSARPVLQLEPAIVFAGR